MNVARRPALESDTAFARQVHHLAYRDVVEPQFGAWVEADQDGYFEGDWQPAGIDIVLCNGVPAGYTCIEDREDDIHIHELVIHPNYQDMSVGSAILREAIARGHRRRVPVRIATFHQNRAADFYRRLGFQEIGRSETHINLEL